ncbi:recombinase family protein [Geobacillus stearothermophilus]|uniref:recombinase family protein n=1 Tax=Geobacillus stearothermophilus TaxID=1422 RepID=UPI003D251671
MRTVAYYRSSTSLQEGSVTTQQRHIREYALKNHILIDEEYEDEFVSARKKLMKERPGLQRMLTDIRKGLINHILVYKRDRLARNLEEHMELYQLFKKHNIQVTFVAENEPPMRFDVMGELFELFIGVMNQREGQQINERIRDTKITNFQSGKSIGKLPYGYKTDPEKTQIIRIEEELHIVKTIFSEWLTEKYKNTNELRKYLKSRGIKRRGKDWTAQRIEEVLTQPMYMGLRIKNFGGIKAHRSVKDLAIITSEQFDKAKELLEKSKTPKAKSKKFDYLLTGFIFCNKCGSPLVEKVRQKHGVPYATYECKENKEIIEQIDVENKVILKTMEFFNVLLKSNFKDLYTRYAKRNIQQLNLLIKELDRELKSLEDKLVRETNRYLMQETKKKEETIIMLQQQINECKNRKLEAELQKIQYQKVDEDSNTLKMQLRKEVFEKLNFTEKQVLLKDLIREILADAQVIKIVFKHPFLEISEVEI